MNTDKKGYDSIFYFICVHLWLLSDLLDSEHAVERDLRPLRHLRVHRDLIDHAAFNQILQRPEQILRRDAVPGIANFHPHIPALEARRNPQAMPAAGYPRGVPLPYTDIVSDYVYGKGYPGGGAEPLAQSFYLHVMNSGLVHTLASSFWRPII